jgi:hypothetical protein
MRQRAECGNQCRTAPSPGRYPTRHSCDPGPRIIPGKMILSRSHCDGASSCADARPAWALVTVVVLALVCLVAGWRLAARARRARGVALPISAAAVVAIAFFAMALFASALRHYGGFAVVGQGGSAYRCGPWYLEIGNNGADPTSTDLVPASQCQKAARRAVGAAVSESALLGLAAGCVAVTWIAVRRRRSTGQDRRVSTEPPRT